jgi:hypothetical protein
MILPDLGADHPRQPFSGFFSPSGVIAYGPVLGSYVLAGLKGVPAGRPVSPKEKEAKIV